MKLVLIGGGEIGRGTTEYETKEIDEEIVKMANKEEPNFLFIGLASSFADSYYDYVKKIYKDFGCKTVYLKKKNVINNPDIVKNKINEADIIYIGGGDTIKLMDTLKEYEIDKLLIEAAKRDCVIAGISAGAIALVKEGFSDSLILRKESDKHTFIKGLGIKNISISPHYHKDETKDKELQESIKNKTVYGIENCTALKIVNDNISVIKSKKEANIYKCSYKDKFIEEKL